MNPKSDADLVRAIQNGDISSFETLVDRYQRGLTSFVIHFIPDAQTAQDVVQDAFVRVYKTIDRVDPSRKFSTYVFEIAKNAALSVLRAKKHTIPLESIVELSDDAIFFEQYLRNDQAQRVREAVNRLPSKYRQVIMLYYFDDVSYEGISTKLQVPINTVRTHLKRAKDLLKKDLPYER